VLLRTGRSILSYFLVALWVCSLFLAAVPSVSRAQDAPEGKNLPQHLTEEELLRLDEIGSLQTATPPPTSPIRNCAQWEPVAGVLIRYDGQAFGISYALIAEMSEDLIIYTLCESNQDQDAYDDMSAGGVNMANVVFIHCQTNSMWTRDYGPQSIFTDGTFGFVDHVYNRPRPLDDQVSFEVGAALGLSVYGSDLITSGGNYMSDGHGIAFSTDLVLDENPTLTYEDISQILEDYMGITQYNVIPDVSTEGIHHIDCWAKLLNEETILVKEVWPEHPDYAAIEANVATLETLTNCYGRPYDIVRVYCGKIRQNTAAAYTNSLILNDKVFVPTFDIDEDAGALATYEAAMPGYEVLGFSGAWLSDDAIHCRAMGIHDPEMLVMDTDPIQDFTDNTGDYTVTVLVDDRSGTGLVAGSPVLYWRLAGETTFNTVTMLPSVDADYYDGDIPQQADETDVEYYIFAEDNSGRSGTRPIGAPEAVYSFNTGTGTTTGDETPAMALRLEQNHPNPFNPSTTISFHLPKDGHVTLRIFDASGREVARLVDTVMPTGDYSFEWNGKDSNGKTMNSGVYFYEIKTALGVESRKMVLIR
jgi:agmatine/peptidylarginine deiminase